MIGHGGAIRSRGPGAPTRRPPGTAVRDRASTRPSTTGPSAPVALVPAHGWTLAQGAWHDVAAELVSELAAGALRLVRHDLRGHGWSTWGERGDEPGGISVDLLGDDLAAVLDRCAPTGPVVLGGHSVGSMTMVRLAARHPELRTSG